MTLSAEMNLSRLEADMELRSLVINNSGLPSVVAGEGITVTEGAIVNVNVDNDTIKINEENQLYVNGGGGGGGITPEELNRLNSELPACDASQLGYALRVNGTRSASWSPVGEPYGTITNSEIDDLF